MKNRFYVPGELRVGSSIQLSGEEFHHAVRVHRSRAGEEVELFDGAGTAVVGRIESIGRSDAKIVIMAQAESREPRLGLDLGLALIQPDRFELVLQKGTELGVRRFLPLITERIEVQPERARHKLERWRKIVLEATKQSGRASLPRIEEPAPFPEVLGTGVLRLIFDADYAASPLPQGADEVLLLIGPEGGWSDLELELAARAGCLFQRLGPRRLRAETAAITAVMLAGIRFGDLAT